MRRTAYCVKDFFLCVRACVCLEEIRIRPLLNAPMAGSGACLSGEGGAISEGDTGEGGVGGGVGVRVEVHERKMKLK